MVQFQERLPLLSCSSVTASNFPFLLQGLRKKSQTNGWKCTLSQDTIHNETPTKKFFKRERWKGVQLSAGIRAGLCSITVWLWAVLRSSLIAKEQLHLCQSGPHDSCGSAAKEGKSRCEGEDHSRGKNHLNTNPSWEFGGENSKEGGTCGKEEKKEVCAVLWQSTCCL